MNSLCQNCQNDLKGEVCHHCGQKVLAHPWTIKLLLGQFLSQLTNLEKGFLHTARALILNPGKVFHDYWKGATVQYYNPFRFLIILTALNVLVSLWLGIDVMIEAQIQANDPEFQTANPAMDDINSKMWSYLNFLVLAIVPVMGLMTWLLFKKKGHNYADHLIMNAFIFGQQALLSSFTSIIFWVFPALFAGYMVFNFVLGVVYQTWVFRQTFNTVWWLALLKAILVGLAGLVVLLGITAMFFAIALRLQTS